MDLNDGDGWSKAWEQWKALYGEFDIEEPDASDDQIQDQGAQTFDELGLIKDLNPIKSLADLSEEAHSIDAAGKQQRREYALSRTFEAFYVLTGISFVLFLITGSVLPLTAVLAFFLALISRLTR
jgi:hypothetical protein